MFGSGANGGLALPHNLEQLLERQWEQGSQFLMEQAQHFDSKLLKQRKREMKNVFIPQLHFSFLQLLHYCLVYINCKEKMCAWRNMWLI